MIARVAAIGLLSFIATVLLWQAWLNAGGEPRKHWFFCDVIKWCDK